MQIAFGRSWYKSSDCNRTRAVQGSSNDRLPVWLAVTAKMLML